MFDITEDDKKSIKFYFIGLGVGCLLIGAFRAGMNALENISN